LYKWFTPGVLVGRPRTVRVFHTFHGHIFSGYYSDAKTRVFLSIEKVLARFATDKIIVISDQQFEEINGFYGVGRAEQFRVIPLGLDLTNLKQNQNLRTGFRNEFGVKDDELLVGIVGRLTEIKNHRLFIEAAQKLQHDTKFSNVRFVIVGDGHMKGELEGLAAESGIIFAGNRNDTAAFYSAIDIMALTSLNEGTPLTLIEGMAFRKPWIASEVGGVVDLAGEVEANDVEGGKSVTVCERGILFGSGDVDGFIEGLSLLVRDQGLRKSLGDRGKRFVTGNYSKERLVSDIRQLYRT
jgi:glycosyltransferase involved in cell wall biosynthesis